MATAAAYGHALGMPVYGVCSLDAIGVDTQVMCWWSPTPAVARCTGRATATACASKGPRVNAPAECRSACRGGRRIARPRRPVRPAVDGIRSIRLRRAWLRPCRLDGAARSRWCRCICVGRMPRRSPKRGVLTVNVSDGPLHQSDAARCAELEVQLFDGDDPWPANGVPARARSPAQPLRRRPGRRQARRLRRHRAAGPETAVRVRNPHHRSGSRLSGPRASAVQ